MSSLLGFFIFMFYSFENKLIISVGVELLELIII